MIYQVHQSVLFSCWAEVAIVHSKYYYRPRTYSRTNM